MTKIIRIVGNNLGGGARLNVYMINSAMHSTLGFETITFIPKPSFNDKYTCSDLVPFKYINTLNFFAIMRKVAFIRTKPIFWLHLRNVSIIWGLICRALSIRYIVHVHAPNLKKNNVRERLIRHFYRVVLQNAYRVVFVSDFVKNDLENDLETIFDRSVVINNGSTQVPHKLSHTNKDVLRIIIVGELTERKGILELPELCSQLNSVAKIDSAVEIEVFGDGPLLQLVKSLANDFPFLKYKGYETNQNKIYDNADFVLMLAHREAFGRVVTEAASIGAVPILRRSGAFPYLVDQLGVGNLFDNIDELTKIIITKIDDSKDNLSKDKFFLMQNFQSKFSEQVFKDNITNLLKGFS